MPTRRSLMLGALLSPLTAPPSGAQQAPAAASPTVLRVASRTIEVNGKPARVLGIGRPDGTDGLTTRVGERFRVRVENALAEPTLIHWHGLAPPWRQDGVPGISGPPIAPGGAADYDFPLGFGGTFWMHSHQGLQEQSLLAAPLIIRDARDRPDEQQIVVMLADFSFTPPEEIFADLRKPAPMTSGVAMPAAAKPAMPGMAADSANAAPDLNDVKYDALLANDRTLADPEVISVAPGGAVLLRIINGASMSAFHVDLGQIEGELIAVDGHMVAPSRGSRFPIAVAQRLDIRLRLPNAPGAWPVLAVLEGERRQTGVILRSGAAPVARVAELAATASAALTLDLEASLRATAPLAPRKADRVHVLNLTGDMTRYVWSINDVVWNPEAPPLPLAKGERVELVIPNRTMMPHPMHLHGHTFQVVAIDGKRFAGARRDTVLVPPNRTVTVAFDADNPGHWAFHCHLLYHMDAGMFATFQYV